jgi:RNA recognition motif-containing protein
MSAFNNAAPTPMYNYQHAIPKPKINPGFNPEVQQDLLTMVFISGIPPVLDNEDMLELLLSCDRVKSWRRVQNSDGSLTHFGFCVFETPLGVIRALRSLPWHEEEEFKHEIRVFIDVATKNHIRTHAEYNKPKRDKAVFEKKKYLFDPYVGLDPEEFLPPKKEEPKPDQQLVTMFENDETEEQIKARKEKREKEMEFAFLERERRFEQQEAIRIK